MCCCAIAWAKTVRTENVRPENTFHLQITGLPENPLKNTLLRLTNQQKSLQNDFTPSVIRRFYHNIPKQIKTAIAPFGYFKARIYSNIHHSKHAWVSDFTVIPGPQMKFTTLDLRISGPGSTDPAFQRLYKKFPVKSGTPFNSRKYEQAKQDLFEVASARGYFKAKMTKNLIVVNLTTYQSHITLHFSTGPRYYFGTTTFSHSPFNTRFLHRFLRYKKGRHFSLRKVQYTRSDLANSNYFQQVIITPKTKQASNLEVPIEISITPQLKKQYTFGLGYGTDTGPRALLGADYRWINQWGHRFNTYMRLSQKNSDLVASYYIPGRHPATDQYIITGGFLDQDQVTGSGQSGRASFIYQTEFLGFQHSFSLTFLHERYNIRSLPKTSTELVYPSYVVQRIKRGNSLSPAYGYSIVAQITGADQAIFSKTSFLQSRIDTKLLFTLFKNTRIILRGTIGYTSIDTLDSLPLSLQFFAGGAESIRGYGYNSIGPGRDILIASAEIQERIYKQFYLVGFFDMGNVNNSIFHDPFNEGVGPGIAWISPIGMFELTIGNAITQPNKPWVIQFSMGPVI